MRDQRKRPIRQNLEGVECPTAVIAGEDALVIGRNGNLVAAVTTSTSDATGGIGRAGKRSESTTGEFIAAHAIRRRAIVDVDIMGTGYVSRKCWTDCGVGLADSMSRCSTVTCCIGSGSGTDRTGK